MDRLGIHIAAFALIVIYVPCAIAGYLMLARFGRGTEGGAYGFLLGPIGMVIAWVLRSNELLDRAERDTPRADADNT